jgi:hypothetical protein
MWSILYSSLVCNIDGNVDAALLAADRLFVPVLPKRTSYFCGSASSYIQYHVRDGYSRYFRLWLPRGMLTFMEGVSALPKGSAGTARARSSQ